MSNPIPCIICRGSCEEDVKRELLASYERGFNDCREKAADDCDRPRNVSMTIGEIESLRDAAKRIRNLKPEGK